MLYLCRHSKHGAVSIYNCGDVTVTNCIFYNNTGTAYFGRRPAQGGSGGLTIGYNLPPPLDYEIINILITNCNFTLNRALTVDFTNPTRVYVTRTYPARGGAVIMILNSPTSVNCTISNNLFVENFAQHSTGAMYLTTVYAGIHQYYCVNNVFTRNSSPNGGALLYVTAGYPTIFVNFEFNIINCTFQSNVGSVYAGAIVFNFFFSPNENAVNVKDCIFYNNTAGEYSGAVDVSSLEFFSYRNATPIRFENW